MRGAVEHSLVLSKDIWLSECRWLLTSLDRRSENVRVPIVIAELEGERGITPALGRAAVDGLPNGFPIVRLMLSRTVAETRQRAPTIFRPVRILAHPTERHEPGGEVPARRLW